MIGRIYTCAFENGTLANASGDYDIFEITPADDKPVYIAGFTLDNVGGTADAGDSQEEMLRLSIIRGYTSSGSGGSATAANGAPLGSSGGAASGFTFDAMNTTVATTGTAVTLWAGGWNVRVPLREFWPEELMPGASQTNTTILLRMHSTVADDIAVSGTMYVVEVG
jgi:hypothetical protein